MERESILYKLRASRDRRRTRPIWRRVVIAFALASFAVGAQSQDHTDWSYNLAMYEVNVRQYTAAGTFAAFETHLDRLEELGVGILWFMPIHPIGVENRLGSLGSYYSVRDYLAVNPEFGSVDDFRSVVDAAHDRGMYVIIDWVANHTSWDNVLTTAHPEWYVRNQGEFIAPPGTNWSDVIELNYAEQGLRDFMIDAMKYWVDEFGIDGFRFDAVSFVPDDFWAEATTALKSAYPNLLLLAENDGRVWHDLGFDMTYAWGLYGFGSGVLKRIADGEYNAVNFGGYAATENTTYGDGAYRLYFTANHDENSWHGTTSELFGDAAETFAVLTATFNGMPLIYSGQEAGLSVRLPFFDKSQINWRDHPNAEMYTRLLALKRENSALWNGSKGGPLRGLSRTNNASVFAFRREKDVDRIVGVFNLTDQQQSVQLNGTTHVGMFVDVFSDEPVMLEDGTSFDLDPWGYRVFSTTATNNAIDAVPALNDAVLDVTYPNPVHGGATVTYTINEPADVGVDLYDVLGRQVRVIHSGWQAPGAHAVDWSAAGLPAGLYHVRLRIEGRTETQPVVVAGF